MARRDIRVMIKELSAPAEMKVRKTCEEYLNLLEDLTYFDPGKMFDSRGKLLEIHEMPFAELMAVPEYQIVEAFIRGKRAMGRSGKKVKLVDQHKFVVTYGKMMGDISDEPPETEEALKCLKVIFVNSKAEPVDVDFMRSPKPPRVIEHDSQRWESNWSGKCGSTCRSNRGSLFLYMITDIENRLTIHFCFMGLRRFRAFRKLLHQDDPSKSAAKNFSLIPEVFDHALSFPAHSRMASTVFASAPPKSPMLIGGR